VPRVTCPSCQKALTLPDPIPAAVRCPACSQVLRLKTPAPAGAVPSRKAPAAESPRRAADLTTEKPRRAVDAEARRPRHVPDDEIEEREEEYEEEPRRPRKRRLAARPWFLHPLILVGAALFALFLVGGLSVGAYFLFRKDESESSAATSAKDLPTYDIKLRQDRKGDKTLITKEVNTTTITTIRGADGIIIKNTTEKTTENIKFVEEILEKEGTHRATRLRRTYEKAQGTKDLQIKRQPYEGQTVLIEKKEKGPKYTFMIEGGRELTGEEASRLSREFDKPEPEVDLEKLMLPGKPVAVGDSWKIDVEPFAKDLKRDASFNINAAQSTATGKLTKVYKKEGKTFGGMDIKMEFAFDSLGDGPQKIAFKKGGKWTLYGTFDVCIDGTSPNGLLTMAATMNGTGSITGPDGKEISVELNVSSSEQTRHEER
jgi:hypothetical protein